MSTPIVQLRIIDISGNSVKAATFQIISMRDKSNLNLKVREDSLFGVYDIFPDNYRAGMHEITVSAEGYSSHSHQADFYVNGYSDTIVLMETNVRNASIRFVGQRRKNHLWI